MWSNTESTRKMWSNTDKGQIEKCQILERCDQIQIKVN